MAKLKGGTRIYGDIKIDGGIYDSSNQVGTAGSVLISTGTGIAWSSVTTSSSGISSYAPLAGIATNVIGGIASVSQINVSGISTFNNITIASGIITTNLSGGVGVGSFLRLKPYLTEGGEIGFDYINGVLGYYIDVDGGNQLRFANYDSTGVFKFITNSTEKVRITNAGLVGIGSASPTVALDVVGSVRSGTANTTVLIGGDAGRNIEIGIGATNIPTFLDFHGADITYSDYGSRLIRNGGDNSDFNIINRGTGALRLITQDAGTIDILTQNTFRHRINSDGIILVGTSSSTGTASQSLQVTGGAYVSGNLGLGVTNPGATLHVVPSSTAISGLFSGTSSDDMVRITQLGTGNALTVEDSTNPDATPFVVTGTGSVGIGTTNPTDRLHLLTGNIRVDGSTGQLSFWNGVGYYGGIGVAGGMGGSGTDIVIRSDTTRSIIFFTGGANDRGRIDSNGTFLVGTATSTGTATQRLQVTGGAYVSGSVGIGTTNPTSTLQVVGNTLVSGVVTATTFLGDLTGTATTATNLADAANITTGTINSARLSGTYNINVSYATTAGIATYATNSGIATYATSSGIATYATNSGIATYATSSGIATYATSSGIATYATSSGIATYATSSGIATYATSSGIATYATSSGIATYATSSGIATYATSSGIATYATNSGIATYATSSGIATYATSSGIATNVIGGIGSIGQLLVSGISTFVNGPVLIGSTVSTGTTSQPLQITGGSYISGNVGVGTTLPLTKVHVEGGPIRVGFITNAHWWNNEIVEQGYVAIASSTSIIPGTENFSALRLTGQRITTSSGLGTVTSIPFNEVGAIGVSTTVVDNGGNDDGYWALTIPFNISFAGITTDKVFVSTNSYITFTDGSTAFSNLAPDTPALPKIMISAADHAGRRIYYSIANTTPNRVYTVRYEGSGSYEWTINSITDLIWEASFYENAPSQIDIQIVKNSFNSKIDSSDVKLQLDGTLGFTKGNILIGDDSTGYLTRTDTNPNSGNAGNVFIGMGAGAVNTGQFNVFLGQKSGFNNTGSYNNFFGYFAGYNNNNNGSNNNFLGKYSGISNQSGSSNNFLGSYSGYLNDGGSDNIFIGQNSGRSNINGDNNIFLGQSSGYLNTGVKNIGIGYQSSYDITTGQYNASFGSGSGRNNKTGNYNIFLGNATGLSESASYKVILGSGAIGIANFDSPDTTKNKQFAVGLNTTGTAEYWLVGNENFNIGIGTTNPTTKLEVGGTVKATTFIGDGSGLTGVVASGTAISVQNDGVTVGSATTINFADNLSVTFSGNVARISGFSTTAAGILKTDTQYTATAGQTTFAATYVVGYVDVYLNGVRLSGSEYTATNGSSIILNEGASLGDIINIVAFSVNLTSVTNSTNVIGGIGSITQLTVSGVTTSSRFISTAANSTSTGDGQIYLNGTTGNRIDFNTNGIAAPSFTTRSIGTKINVFPQVDATNVDYAVGIDTGTLWQSIPQSNSSFQHRWYGGTTQLMDLKGTGELVVGVTTLTGTSSQRLQVNSGAYFNGRIGIAATNPTSRLHIEGGTASANTAPLEINSGTLLASIESDVFEYDGVNLYHTGNDTINGSGRAVIPEVMFRRLPTTNTVGAAASNIFGVGIGSFSVLANRLYEFECNLYMRKTVTGVGTITFNVSAGNFVSLSAIVPTIVTGTGGTSVQTFTGIGTQGATVNNPTLTTVSLTDATSYVANIKGTFIPTTNSKFVIRGQAGGASGTLSFLPDSFIKLVGYANTLSAGNVT